MALDPRIALAVDTRLPLLAQAPQVQTPDVYKPLMAAAQLKELQSQSGLRQFQMQKAMQEEQRRQQLGAHLGQYNLMDPAQAQQAMQGALRIDPEAGLKMGANILSLQKEDRLSKSAEVDYLKKQYAMMGQAAQAVLDAEERGQDPQAAYTFQLEQLRQGGLPLAGVSPTYDRNQVLQMRDQVRTQEQRLDEARLGMEKAAKAAQERHQQATLAESKRAAEEQATLTREGHTVQRRGQDISRQNALTAAGGLVDAAERAGQKAYETEKMRLQAQQQFEPLTGEAAKAVSEYNAMIGALNALGEQYDPNYTGPIRGRYGAFKELTGDISKDEVQFRRKVADIRSLLSHARLGATLTSNEIASLERLVPDPKQPANVFEARLEDFGREVERQRDERIRTARTGRGSLTGPTVHPLPARPTPARPSPGTTPEQQAIRDQLKRDHGMTDAQIDEALRQ